LTNLVMGEVTFLVMRRSFWLNVWDTIFRDCEFSLRVEREVDACFHSEE
jgi:hypothetical protein